MKRALVLVGLAGCGHPAAAPTERTPVEQLFSDDPIAIFYGLEERLTAAREVTILARTPELTIAMHVRRDGESTIEIEGATVRASWSSEHPANPDNRDVQPDTWADSLVLGVTRLGALHDAALIVLGRDPETGHGDLATWATVDDLVWEDGTLRFAVSVDGAAPSSAQLTFDAEGLPVRRVSGGTHESYPRFIVK